MTEVGMCTVCPLMHIGCTVEGRRLLNDVDASTRRAVVGVGGQRPHTAMWLMLMRGRMRNTVMSAIGVGVVVEVTREAVHRGIDWEAVRVVMFPALGIIRRQHTRALGERVLAKRNVLVGRRLHDVSIENVGVQDSCSVVVFEVCRVFRVGLLLVI